MFSLIFSKYLQDNDITAYQVAKGTGISQGTMNEYKNGKKVPNIDNLVKIANYLKVSTDYLLGINDSSPQNAYLESTNTKKSYWMSNVYTKCYVAFLDILGFKTYINEQEFEEVLKIFKIYDFIRDRIKSAYVGPAFTNGELSDLKFNCISDTIVISIPKANPRSLEILIFAVDTIIDNFIRCRKLLIRGAISEGDFYSDENNYLFGKALVKAYEYERSLSIFPRVIIMPELIEKYLSKSKTSLEDMKFLISYDHVKNDGLYIVNYVKYILTNLAVERPQNMLERGKKQWTEFLKSVHFYLKGCGIINIREKYIYFKDYYNFELNELKESEYAFFNSTKITNTVFDEYWSEKTYSEAARSNQNNISPDITTLDNAPEQDY